MYFVEKCPITPPAIVTTGSIDDNARANRDDRAYARTKPVMNDEKNTSEFGTFSEIPDCTRSVPSQDVISENNHRIPSARKYVSVGCAHACPSESS